MSKKINKSAYISLLVMKYILNNNVFKIEDILNYLEFEYDIFIYKETVLKYIRTLKHIGFKFERMDNKTYKLIYSACGFNILQEEKDAIANLLSATLDLDENITKTIDKIKILIPQIDYNFYHTEEKKINEFKTYCKDKLRLKIIYKDDKDFQDYFIEPYEVLIVDNVWKLKAYNLTNKENVLLNINNILEVIQTPMKNKFKFKEKTVLLKFSADLAKVYILKENEEIIKKDKTGIWIMTSYYDKKLFFNNILRYMDNCEILSPQYLREDFIKYVESLYKMYDCVK